MCWGTTLCISSGRQMLLAVSDCAHTAICFSFFAKLSQLLGNYSSACLIFSLYSFTGICFLGTLHKVTRLSWYIRPCSGPTFKQVWKIQQTNSLLFWKQLSTTIQNITSISCHSQQGCIPSTWRPGQAQCSSITTAAAQCWSGLQECYLFTVLFLSCIKLWGIPKDGTKLSTVQGKIELGPNSSNSFPINSTKRMPQKVYVKAMPPSKHITANSVLTDKLTAPVWHLPRTRNWFPQKSVFF